MKVGYVFTDLPRLAGTFPNAELDEMAARGIEIEIFILRTRRHDDPECARLERAYPVHRCPYLLSARMLGDLLGLLVRRPGDLMRLVFQVVRDTGRSPRVLAKSLGVLPKSIRFATIARERGCDLVHAYWASLPALSASVISRFSGIPFSSWAHAGADIYNGHHQTDAALRSRLREASWIFTCNGPNLDHFALVAGPEVLEKVELLTHGIDLDRFPSLPAHPRASQSGTEVPVILALGRLSAAKGYDHLVSACSILAGRGRRFRCRIVGSGPQGEALRAQIRSLGLEETVELVDPVPHERVPDLHRGADVFVASSVIGPKGSRDGLPNVLLEAMASGLPCVGSAVAAIPEAIHDGVTGLLVPPGDPRALAEAIERILADPALSRRLGAAGATLVRERYARKPAMDRLHARMLALVHAGADGAPVAMRAP